jgi:hypothetical protein
LTGERKRGEKEERGRDGVECSFIFYFEQRQGFLGRRRRTHV